jgi:hypothetical protein
MNRRLSQIALLVLAFAFCECAAAQDFAIAAEPAKKKYDMKIEELRAKYQTELKVVTTEYRVKLDDLIKTATANGDLDKVLTFKAEKEWIEDGKLPKDTAASLKIMQAIRTAFELKKKTANANFEKGAKQAHADFLTDLDAVVKDETKEGRIESALKVRETRKEIEKSSMPPAVPDVLASEKPANETEPAKTDPEKKAPKAEERRDYWVKEIGGFFKLGKDGTWTNHLGTVYKETARTNEYIEIAKGPGLSYRMFADHWETKEPNKPWKQGAKGKWE